HFEPNQGQVAAPVQFTARGKGFNLLLTSDRAVLVLQKPLRPVGAPATAPATSRAVLHMQLVGANPQVQAQGLDLQPGRSNYLRGSRLHWRTNIPNYGKVLYPNIYPGINLVYNGGGSAGHQVQYDFVVSPGANPSVIRFAHQGVASRRIDAQGR